MTGETKTKLRLVRCPKCREVLPELPDIPVYQCGGCGTVLQAKHRKIETRGTESGLNEVETEHIPEQKKISSLNQAASPSKDGSSAEASTSRSSNEFQDHNIKQPGDRSYSDELPISSELSSHENGDFLQEFGEQDKHIGSLDQDNTGEGKHELGDGSSHRHRARSFSDDLRSSMELTCNETEDSSPEFHSCLSRDKDVHTFDPCIRMDTKEDDVYKAEQNKGINFRDKITKTEDKHRENGVSPKFGLYGEEGKIVNLSLQNGTSVERRVAENADHCRESSSSPLRDYTEHEKSATIIEANQEIGKSFKDHRVEGLKVVDNLGKSKTGSVYAAENSVSLDNQHLEKNIIPSRDFDCGSSVDSFDKLPLDSPSSVFGMKQTDFSKSSMPRNYYSYDGSVSSFDGYEDQIPGQFSKPPRRRFKHSNGLHRHEESRTKDFQTNKSDTSHQAIRESTRTHGMLSSESEIRQEARKSLLLDENSRYGMKHRQNKLDDLPEYRSYGHPSAGRSRGDKEDHAAGVSFIPRYSGGQRNGNPLNYQHHVFQPYSDSFSPDMPSYAEPDREQLLRMVHELTEELNRTQISKSRYFTGDEIHAPLNYNHLAPAEEICADMHFPRYPGTGLPPPSSLSNLQEAAVAEPSHTINSKKCCRNVFSLLARREVCPRSKHSSRKFWGETSTGHPDSCGIKSESARDARRGLISWVETESLQHLSAKYCPLLPPPRSTIAAAFGPDGKTLASTHGDHTVKIIDCQSGKCLKVLSGHRRTPWVVRFHPLHPELLASGSLDHEVRLWDARTAECIGSRDFFRPIASIAFHSQGEFLAVASGHKLYIWHYNKRGEASSPTIILKTRRSLRAVHFHPYAAPFLLTAEVNDLDSSDSSMTLATSPGYLRYPPPTVYLADAQSTSRPNVPNELPLLSLPFLIWPLIGRSDGRTPSQQTDTDPGLDGAQQRVDTSTSVRLLTYSTPSGQYELLLSPMEPDGSPVQEQQINSMGRETEVASSQLPVDPMETDMPHDERTNNFFPFSDPAYWELPFLQGWLIGQSQAGLRALRSQNGGASENISSANDMENHVSASSAMPIDAGSSRVTGRSGSRHRSSRSRLTTVGSGDSAALNNMVHDVNNPQSFMGQVQPEVANSLAAAAAAELPCTVKLRIWSHDVKDPCAPLDVERCRLTIPHAVLCSEMGAHFSPCGRFLAACVACVLPHMEADPGFHGQVHHDATGIATSPTRHPISAHKVLYELRIYSLEESTFGLVLASRAIRAAHCLTSIQFSPTSEHLLLAYGRRHNSLLKSVVIDGDMTVPIYTILEVYRVSDMELVRVLPSAEDEVNVACFHPSVGGGLVYGTKEGKLRILQYSNVHGSNQTASCFSREHMLEVPTYALEG